MKKSALLALHLLIGGIAAFLALTVGCPLRRWLGICCPGCGMTRAYLALFQLDFAAAFRYHPLFWLFPPLLFLYIHRRPFRLPGKERGWNILLGIGCLLLATVYVLRLLMGSEIIYIDPTKGALWQLLLPEIG